MLNSAEGTEKRGLKGYSNHQYPSNPLPLPQKIHPNREKSNPQPFSPPLSFPMPPSKHLYVHNCIAYVEKVGGHVLQLLHSIFLTLIFNWEAISKPWMDSWILNSHYSAKTTLPQPYLFLSFHIHIIREKKWSFKKSKYKNTHIRVSTADWSQMAD